MNPDRRWWEVVIEALRRVVMAKRWGPAVKLIAFAAVLMGLPLAALVLVTELVLASHPRLEVVLIVEQGTQVRVETWVVLFVLAAAGTWVGKVVRARRRTRRLTRTDKRQGADGESPGDTPGSA